MLVNSELQKKHFRKMLFSITCFLVKRDSLTGIDIKTPMEK